MFKEEQHLVKVKVKRLVKVKRMRDAGMTYAFIGCILGISRQRVHQILYPESRRNAKKRYRQKLKSLI